MRSSAIAVSLLTALIVSLALPSQLAAQEWSAEQQEVWQNVETYWVLSIKEDLEGLMSYMHDDFLGWAPGQSFPTNKADRRAVQMRSYETSDNVLYTLKPIGIKVHGDVAIVHYFFSYTDVDAKGEEQSAAGHWTDILMKQGNRWIMIGDAGGTVSEN
jgi:ketosteroid isomerase-like protein